MQAEFNFFQIGILLHQTPTLIKLSQSLKSGRERIGQKNQRHMLSFGPLEENLGPEYSLSLFF